MRLPALDLPPAHALRAAALLALALASCAPPRDDDLFGMTLDVRSQQPWASSPDLRRDLHALLEASCAHEGLDPSLLYGMTLRIEDGEIVCGTVSRARGCTWREEGIIAISTLAWTSAEPRVPCVQDTPIPHELLHVMIGDPNHADARWHSAQYWAPLWEQVTSSECSGDVPLLIW